MKRFAIGLLIAVVAIVLLVGIASASGRASPWIEQKDTNGASTHASLGINLANVNQKIKEQFNLTVDSGVVVIKVAPEGAAHNAGLRAGDVIQAINGAAVENVGQGIQAIRSLAGGSTVTLTVLRGSEVLSIAATLAARLEPAVPSDLVGLLRSALAGRFLRADYQILGADDKPVTVGVMLGTVQSVTNAGVLTIVRKDGQAVQFQTTTDTKVVVGGHAINLAGLKTETPVVLVEKAGAVVLVMGWPGDMLGHSKPKPEKSKGHDHDDGVTGQTSQAPGALGMPGVNPRDMKERIHKGKGLGAEMRGMHEKEEDEDAEDGSGSSSNQPAAPANFPMM